MCPMGPAHRTISLGGRAQVKAPDRPIAFRALLYLYQYAYPLRQKARFSYLERCCESLSESCVCLPLMGCISHAFQLCHVRTIVLHVSCHDLPMLSCCDSDHESG